MRTMKPQVTVQRIMDATVLEEISHRTPTIQGHQLEDLLRAATALALPVKDQMATREGGSE
jgi:hypothetical protein